MATFYDDLKTILTGDGALSALLPGGWFSENDLDQDGMSMDNAPRVSSGSPIIAAFGVIHEGDMPAYSIPKIEAERGALELYVYAPVPVTVRSAMKRIKVLLQRRIFTGMTDRQMVHLQFAHTSRQYPAEELNNAHAQFIRFEMTQIVVR